MPGQPGTSGSRRLHVPGRVRLPGHRGSSVASGVKAELAVSSKPRSGGTLHSNSGMRALPGTADWARGCMGNDAQSSGREESDSDDRTLVMPARSWLLTSGLERGDSGVGGRGSEKNPETPRGSPHSLEPPALDRCARATWAGPWDSGGVQRLLWRKEAWPEENQRTKVSGKQGQLLEA